jgi:MFS family permease
MCLVNCLNFLDKQTLNYANAYNLQKDLDLRGDQYNWCASIVNFGIIISMYPTTLVLQKYHLGRVVGSMLLLWGAILMASSAAKNFATLAALRLLLGLVEACLGPAWVQLTSVFWTRKEQPLRMCIWLGCNGVSQMIGAGLSWGLGGANLSIAPWQLIYLVSHPFHTFRPVLTGICHKLADSQVLGHRRDISHLWYFRGTLPAFRTSQRSFSEPRRENGGSLAHCSE